MSNSEITATVDALFAEEQAFLVYASRCLREMKKARKDLSSAAANKEASGLLWKMSEEQREALSHPRSLAIGRIDLADGENWHIGPRVLWDGAKAVVIYWATQAAEPYYEATTESPMGLQQRVTLRSEFDVLRGIRREILGTGRGTEAEPVFDDMLLAELSRHRTGAMSEVAATIKRDQYRIIKAPADRPMVVQGGPGTGKTVVGLHRAAFILYRSRERAEATSSSMLIVGPNPLFMSYIQLVLPQLGETSADQVAVRSLGRIDVRSAEDPMVANVKAKPEMAAVLARAVRNRVRPLDRDLSVSIAGESLSIPRDFVNRFVADFDPQRQPYREAREAFRNALQRKIIDEYVERRTSDDLALDDVRANPQYQRAVDRIWPTLSAEEIVRQLLSSEERLESAGESLLTGVERRILFRKPVDTMDEVMWTPADCALVDEVRTLVEGRPTTYSHVVVDETQDLTPMELRMVGRRVRRGAITALGDLAQATGNWDYDDWGTIALHLGLTGTKIEELTHAYRVPGQIMRLALRILAYTAPATTPPAPYRDGPVAPKWLRVSEADLSLTAVREAQIAQAAGGTVAIIAPRRLSGQVRVALAGSHIKFEDADRGELGSAIELLDATQAKGLEFDHVVLLEPAAIVREHPDGRGLRALYVALTRATTSLICVYAEQLPWPLGTTDG